VTNYDVVTGAGAILRLAVNETSQDIPDNESVDGWSLVWYKGSASSWSASPITWQVVINGNTYSGTFTFDFGATSSVTIATGSTTIPHTADGTKTISVSGYIGATGTSSGGPASTGGSFVQTTIPRASTPTFEKVSDPGVLITACDAGLAIKINTNRASGTFTHTLKYAIGADNGTIATGVGASEASWTIPTSLMNQIPNNLSGIVTITVETYSGATLIGTTNTPLTMTVPTSVIPTIGSITDSEGTAGLAANVGLYVQNLTKLNLAIVGAAGASGSTISTYKLEVNSQTINAVSGITPSTISASGTIVVTATVTDSRGRIGTLTKNVTLLAYAPPSLGTISVQRALVSGTPDDDGTYIRVNINSSVQSLINSTERNALVYKVWTRDRLTGGAWTLKSNVTPGGVTFNSYALINTYSVTQSWDVLVEILDDFGTSALQLIIATATIFMDWDGSTGIGIGKYRQQGALDAKYLTDADGRGVIFANDIDVRRLATTTLDGVVNLATDAEAQAKSGSWVVTGSNLAALEASTTFSGFSERATNAEALAENTTRHITGENLAHVIKRRVGLIPIFGTSITVTGSGSSASVGDNGLITFSNCATIMFNGMLSATYLRYLFRLAITGGAAAQNIFMRLTTGGTATTNTLWYKGIWYRQASSIATHDVADGSADVQVGYSGGVVAIGVDSDIEIKYPRGSGNNYPIMKTNHSYSDTSHTDMRGSAVYRALASYDGFRIATHGGGLINGSLMPYAYIN